MTKEFDLSEKIEEYGRKKNFIWMGDVKEFIRLLKDWVGNENSNIRGNTYRKKIDKLAGAKLK